MLPIETPGQPVKASPRAVLTQLAGERQRRDIGIFARRAWHIIEPKRCVWNWHMDAILEHLVYVTQFEIRFLAIAVPPRTSKSLLSSVLWPVWHWLQDPTTQFICASYTTKLSANFAGLSRRLIESTWFQQFYGPEFYLLPDENKKEMYRNSEGGYRISTSVKGGISTGFGGDIQCFPAGTLVSTEVGEVPIECLEHLDCRVYSFDKEKTRLSKKTGFYKSISESIVTLRFSNGGVLRCTPEHPVFVVGHGWKRASSIKSGDLLYASTEPNLSSVSRMFLSCASSCGATEMVILFKEMLRNISARRAKFWWQMHGWFQEKVRGLRKRYSRQTVRWQAQRAQNLFGEMQVSTASTRSAFSSCEEVPVLSEGNRSGMGNAPPDKALLNEMLSVDPQQKNERQGKRKMDSWASWKSIRTFQPVVEDKSKKARPELLSSLWDQAIGLWKRTRCASRKLQQKGSFGYKSCGVVSPLPRNDAWSPSSTRKMEEVLVIATEENNESCDVYCIDVAGDHNFFANGILVHNCIDDPLSADDANSDTETNNVIVWHDGTFRSRVNDPNRSRKVLIAQRLRDNDLFGHLMEREGRRWVQLVLPMEHDTKRVCITYPNKGSGIKPDAIAIFKDPRKVDGELLNPKRFNSETCADEKDVVSERDWNAQYQQQPEGQGGLILKRKWWRQWVYPEWHVEAGRQRPLPDFIEIIQVYDTALEEDEEADYSAMTTWGIFAHRESEKDPKTGRIIDGRQRICALMLDMMEERLEFPDLRTEVIRRYHDFKPDNILVEKKASGHGLVQELRRKELPVKAVKLTDGGDLVARVKTSSLVLEAGCIFYVPMKWALHVIDSAAKFPAAKHDDIVATLAIAWQYMRRHSDLTLPDDEDTGEIAPFKWRRRKYG